MVEGKVASEIDLTSPLIQKRVAKRKIVCFNIILKNYNHGSHNEYLMFLLLRSPPIFIDNFSTFVS